MSPKLLLRSINQAFLFLTVLPVFPTKVREGDARLAVYSYPVVGLTIGCILALAILLMETFVPSVRGALLLGLWIFLTGALHLDGFCDMADAALAVRSPEQRRMIAKDPHLGSFALSAGGVLLFVKFAALGATTVPQFLILIPLLARGLVIVSMTLFTPYPESVLGKSARLSPHQSLVPLGFGILLSTGLLAIFPAIIIPALWVAGVGLLTSLGITYWLSNRMGGVSGDVFGASIEGAEAVMLVASVSFGAAV